MSTHKIDMDTLFNKMRCVEREGNLDGVGPVTFMRVFRPKEGEQKGVAVTGGETLDQHPELVLFEGYFTRSNKDTWSGEEHKS